jgi:hypothetical protein
MHTHVTMVATQERQGKEIILRTFEKYFGKKYIVWTKNGI